MTQREFEIRLLKFLKHEGGLVLHEQINAWQMSHPELLRYPVKETLENLCKQNLIEKNERGIRAL